MSKVRKKKAGAKCDLLNWGQEEEKFGALAKYLFMGSNIPST